MCQTTLETLENRKELYNRKYKPFSFISTEEALPFYLEKIYKTWVFDGAYLQHPRASVFHPDKQHPHLILDHFILLIFHFCHSLPCIIMD